MSEQKFKRFTKTMLSEFKALLEFYMHIALSATSAENCWTPHKNCNFS